MDRFETTTLTRQIVSSAAPLSVVAVCLYMAVVFALNSEDVDLVFYLTPGVGFVIAAVCAWRELRIPRHVRFDDGFMTLESVVGCVVIRDGDVLSLALSFWQPIPSIIGPTRLVLRFRGGRHNVYGDFPHFAEFVGELQRRNPAATITTLRRAA
jgi:hypothetical protein